MASALKAGIKKLVRRLGYDVVRYDSSMPTAMPQDFAHDDIEICTQVAPFTMNSPEAVHEVCAAVRYIVENRIPGAIVECGVWKGGSMMAAALTLLKLGNMDYDLYLLDTFEGMSEPSERDVKYTGELASELLARAAKTEAVWANAPLEAVRDTLFRTGYDAAKWHFVKGRVEDTIPAAAPKAISLLRLDTDWYESTRHELIHLFPRLSRSGVLIIADYGYWQGARQAVDEYFREREIGIFLGRTDLASRIGVKL